MPHVPVVLQLTENECGAACLTMVLRYHGAATRLSECREACGSGRDGATALAIVAAARANGLEARGFSASPDALDAVPLPAVLLWEGNHFVVLERLDACGASLVDPALGRRSISRDELGRGFSGVVLTFEPGSGFTPGARPARGFRWWSYLRLVLGARGVRTVLAQVIAASVVLQVLGLVPAVFTKIVFDEILPQSAWALWSVLGAALVVWIAAHALATYLRAALLVYLQARLDSQLMLGFFAHLLALPLHFFQQRTSGDLMMRLGSNAILRQLLTEQTIATAFDSVLVVSYLVLLAVLSPTFALLGLGLGALQVALVAGTTRRMYGLLQQDLALQADSQSYLVEALAGIATLKASGGEASALRRWGAMFTRAQAVALRRSRLSALVETGMGALQLAAPMALLWIGAREVLTESMTLGTMLALSALAAGFLVPLASLVSQFQSLQLVGAHLDRIADVLEAEPEQDVRAESDPGGLARVRAVRGAIELRGISFRYDPTAPLVLQGIDLAIRPGEKVVLVGRTGSGKSTLGKLLLGLHEPTAGEVRIDGRPFRDYPLAALRRRFGVVMQEPFLLAGSVRENIAFHAPELPLDALHRAARLAEIADEIDALPMGWETRLSEGGRGLSGGQRQRVALARALAHDPILLFLDEATSHLDVVTEGRVDANLTAVACTRILVAHRLSTIRSADRILVLDAGRLVESGSHDELIAKAGRYAALVREQL